MFRLFRTGSRKRRESRQADDWVADPNRGINRGQAGADEHGIHYDPGLIDNLRHDHSHLVSLFGRILNEGFEADDWKKVAELVTRFKRDFQAHLLKENVKFYVYLEQQFASDASTIELVKDFRKEMNGIAGAVVKFCKTYGAPEVPGEARLRFRQEYDTVGEVLGHRISLEENELYTLYQP